MFAWLKLGKKSKEKRKMLSSLQELQLSRKERAEAWEEVRLRVQEKAAKEEMKKSVLRDRSLALILQGLERLLWEHGPKHVELRTLLTRVSEELHHTDEKN